MNIVVAPSSGELGKFLGVVTWLPGIWKGLVLDVGARSGNLRRALPARGVRYVALDRLPPADVIADLEQGLPFANGSVDVVVALDVLEHTNDIHAAFAELCRVARQFVCLSLPNTYDLLSRVKFMLGLPLSAKYGLPSAPQPDRHRWLFSLRDAQRFTQTMSRHYGFVVRTEACLVGPRRGSFWTRSAIRQFPNLLAPHYVALIEGQGAKA